MLSCGSTPRRIGEFLVLVEGSVAFRKVLRVWEEGKVGH